MSSVPRLGRRPLTFGAVGVLNTAVGLSAYTAGLDVLHLPYLWSLLVGHLVSVCFAYPLHRRLVFRVTGTVARDFVRYEVVTLTSLALNALLLTLAVAVLKTPQLAAEVMVTGLLAVGSYLAHRDFSFARRARAAGEE